jgi:hypothetical protein
VFVRVNPVQVEMTLLKSQVNTREINMGRAFKGIVAAIFK